MITKLNMETKADDAKRSIRKVVLTINREILTFLIIDRNIFYTDRKFGVLVRILPKPKNLLLTIQKSRNRVPMFIVKLFELSKEELAEYDAAKTVDELADIVIRDGKRNGCILVANANLEADAELVKKIQSQEVVA